MNKVTVSLTSFPEALPFAAEAVRSVLGGTVRPDRVVLYLTETQFEGREVPDYLRELAREDGIFEIRFWPEAIRSYTKLVPALSDFPDDVIVTVDDDVRYHPRMLEVLLKYHGLHPGMVIAHRAKRIEPERPYRKWPKYRWYHFLSGRERASFSNLQTGVGGVLYPPGSLKKEMLDPAHFMRIAPTADDIWFWAAATAAGTKVFPVPFGQNKPKDLGKPGNLSLKMLNFKRDEDRNRKALDIILREYPDIRERVEDEKAKQHRLSD